LNRNRFINYEYNNWIASQQAQNEMDQFRITRGRHKKSFSDPFTKNFENLEDNQMKIYNMFMNMKPPEDFLNKINVRKDTAESNFSINANLDFVDETWQEPSLSNQEFAIKNYPINSHFMNPKFRNEMRASSPQPQRNRSILQNGNYFRENLTLDELEKLEKKPPGYFPAPNIANIDPPGLTPTSFMQKNYQTFSDSLPKPTNSIDNISPNIKARGNPMAYPQDVSSIAAFNTAYQTPPMQQQQQVYQPNPYMNERNMHMHMGASPFNRGQPQMMQYNQPQNFMQNPKANNNHKLIPLDDGGRRYTGHLKFFDETKNYGFIVMDDDGSDIFVHFDDLMKANLTKDLLRTAKNGNVIHLSFSCMQYVGKYNKSRKAVEIQILM